MKKPYLMLILLFIPLKAVAQNYPAQWFQEVPRSEAHSWEILPQDAKTGEVILSKRTELGVFSNFAATPFILDGKSFASVEGLWQSLKYPDPEMPHDIRHTVSEWPHTRDAVAAMVAFEAKDAGNAAKNIYLRYNFHMVNWFGYFFDYTNHPEGSAYHYVLIKRALKAKLDQNPGLWDLLMKTGCLVLKPDHYVEENDPPSYRYYQIFMELRSERQYVPCSQ
jgi:hypothetical protein